MDTEMEVCVLSLSLEFLHTGVGFACAAACKCVDCLSGALMPSSDPFTSAASAPPLLGELPSKGATGSAQLVHVHFMGYVVSPLSAVVRQDESGLVQGQHVHYPYRQHKKGEGGMSYDDVMWMKD